MLTTDAVGGVWNYTLSLAKGLVTAGWECIIVVVGPAAEPLQRGNVSEAGAKLIETNLELDWTAQRLGQVKATASELAALGEHLNADLAHIHTPVFALAEWKMPVVAVAHSCVATWWEAVYDCRLPDAIKWRWEAMQQGLAAADSIIAPSTAFAAALTTTYGKIEGLNIVCNGHEPFGWSSRSAETASFVMASGRLWDAGKNMEMLDEATGLQTNPVVAVGPISGPDGTEFRARHMSTPGVVSSEELTFKYRNASLLAAPSLYEPFGLVVLEAASAGLPLLLSDIPTFRELWTGAAVFVPPRDAAGWARAISSLMDDKPERLRLGAAARTRSLNYGREKMVGRTCALHEAVLATAGHLRRC